MTPSMSVRPRNPLFSPPRPVVGDATRMRPSSSSCRRTIVPWSSPARPVPIGASIAGDTLARPCCSTKGVVRDRKSTRLNSSHSQISYAVFCLKKKKHHCNDGLRQRNLHQLDRRFSGCQRVFLLRIAQLRHNPYVADVQRSDLESVRTYADAQM